MPALGAGAERSATAHQVVLSTPAVVHRAPTCRARPAVLVLCMCPLRTRPRQRRCNGVRLHTRAGRALSNRVVVVLPARVEKRYLEAARMTRSLAVLLLFTPALAWAEDLQEFLSAATVAARPTQALRADGVLTTTSAAGSSRQPITLVQRPNGDLYLELREAGVRALLTAVGEAWLAARPGAPAAPLALDAPLAGSEFTREDLQPFVAMRFAAPSIVDRTPEDVTVSLDPQASQYRLVVITFDRDKRVPLKVLSYRDSLHNLVKLRRERDHVRVGGRWVPREVAIEHFPLRASSVLSLRWSTAAEMPGLFDPGALDRSSPLPVLTP